MEGADKSLQERDLTRDMMLNNDVDVNQTEGILTGNTNGVQLEKPVPQLETDGPDTAVSSQLEQHNQRPKWSRRIEFLLACMGFSVGLGNVWRFPYLCYKNGGGAFLIPYLLCAMLAGIPMFFLEVALGQFMSIGCIGVWDICPLFKGIGFASVIIAFLLNIYYNVILAWAFYYLFSSFTRVLPWSHCHNPWNTARCLVAGANLSSDSPLLNDSNTPLLNISNSTAGVDPATEFWQLKALQISDGIEHLGGVRWEMALCLLLAWAAVYVCIWKGIKYSGKVLYVTAPAPYLFLLVLLINGATLPGSLEGIKFFLIPDWSRLADLEVWLDAGIQIFFTYSLSNGVLIALGSYNQWDHNCWRDTWLFAGINTGTSLLAGFVIFPVLGFMSQQLNVPISEVADSGPGLAFIAYPKAVAQMPLAPLWSALFFIMIILLGMDSQFVCVEGFVTALTDEFSGYFTRKKSKELFIAGVCTASFLCGLSMVTRGGIYVFQIFDYFSNSRTILIVALLETLVVGWIYGADRFYDNIEMMLGRRINIVMKIAWCYTTPLVTLTVLVLFIFYDSELTYNRTYHYPAWAISIGWVMASSSVVMIPLTMAYKIIRAKGSLKQRVTELLRPKLKEHQIVQKADGEPILLNKHLIN